MWHVIPEREKNITTKNKKAAFEYMKANRRSNNASSKEREKGKNCLNHLKLGMEPEEDIKGHFLRDKQRSRERTEENYNAQSFRNWKVSLENTVKAVQEMALRGREHQSCKAFAMAFNYNGGCVHIFSEERPTQGFLIFCSHIAWRQTSCQKTIKNHFKK